MKILLSSIFSILVMRPFKDYITSAAAVNNCLQFWKCFKIKPTINTIDKNSLVPYSWIFSGKKLIINLCLLRFFIHYWNTALEPFKEIIIKCVESDPRKEPSKVTMSHLVNKIGRNTQGKLPSKAYWRWQISIHLIKCIFIFVLN